MCLLRRILTRTSRLFECIAVAFAFALRCSGRGGAAGGLGWGLMPWRSMLRIDSAAVLALGLVRQNSRLRRSNSCRKLDDEALPVLRQAKPSPSTALLAAPEIAPSPDRLPRPRGCERCAQRSRMHSDVSRAKACGPLCRRASRAPSSAVEPARLCVPKDTHKLRDLACGSCLSRVNAVNVASSAAGPAPRAAQGSQRRRR